MNSLTTIGNKNNSNSKQSSQSLLSTLYSNKVMMIKKQKTTSTTLPLFSACKFLSVCKKQQHNNKTPAVLIPFTTINKNNQDKDYDDDSSESLNSAGIYYSTSNDSYGSIMDFSSQETDDILQESNNKFDYHPDTCGWTINVMDHRNKEDDDETLWFRLIRNDEPYAAMYLKDDEILVNVNAILEYNDEALFNVVVYNDKTNSNDMLLDKFNIRTVMKDIIQNNKLKTSDTVCNQNDFDNLNFSEVLMNVHYGTKTKDFMMKEVKMPSNEHDDNNNGISDDHRDDNDHSLYYNRRHRYSTDSFIDFEHDFYLTADNLS